MWVPKAKSSEPPAVAGGDASAKGKFLIVDGTEVREDVSASDKSSFRTGAGDSGVRSSASEGEEEGGDPRSCGGHSEEPLQEGARALRERVTWRDTVPPELIQRGEEVVPVRERNSNEGNTTVGFGNWGALPADPKLRTRIQLMLQRGPAMIWMLAECSHDMEAMMRMPGSPPQIYPHPRSCGGCPRGRLLLLCGLRSRGGAHSCPKLEARTAYQFLTARGSEDFSVCIAVRANVCSELKVLYWQRIRDGEYKSSKGRTIAAYTRLLVAEATFDQSLAWFGNSANICCVHLHRMTAKSRKEAASEKHIGTSGTSWRR